ncbi:hypothetical protein PYCCODRAFT_1423332 [Trametes coccinea BRFM310]|uniref:Uncharacterized protein n=1 Tax=Trametes coccinea (strain BRFM310) TaxID=1353009 RepID=A0A1Y2IVY7_TRAC3|nr:hypothetical protein PYCCODRAFT_1423332 [Trametes coccinea BRFM310]
MTQLRVYVAQYYNGVGPNGTRPYYWQVCIETALDWKLLPVATVFTITGSAAAGFTPSTEGARYFTTSPLYRGSVCIGAIDIDHYALAETCIQSAELYRRGCYDSQDWVEAAVRKLYAHGLIGTHWTKAVLQNEFQAMEAAWESGDL